MKFAAAIYCDATNALGILHHDNCILSQRYGVPSHSAGILHHYLPYFAIIDLVCARVRCFENQL